MLLLNSPKKEELALDGWNCGELAPVVEMLLSNKLAII
jgi:hypothetical protein